MDRFSASQAHNAIARALEAGTAPHGLPAAQLFAHGTAKLFFYQPRGRDHQPPHDQDELYIVVSGTGSFVMGNGDGRIERTSFIPGDAIFAPAGAVHRFEDFSDDFATWVVMYGPDGGERPD